MFILCIYHQVITPASMSTCCRNSKICLIKDVLFICCFCWKNPLSQFLQRIRLKEESLNTPSNFYVSMKIIYNLHEVILLHELLPYYLCFVPSLLPITLTSLPFRLFTFETSILLIRSLLSCSRLQN